MFTKYIWCVGWVVANKMFTKYVWCVGWVITNKMFTKYVWCVGWVVTNKMFTKYVWCVGWVPFVLSSFYKNTSKPASVFLTMVSGIHEQKSHFWNQYCQNIQTKQVLAALITCLCLGALTSQAVPIDLFSCTGVTFVTKVMWPNGVTVKENNHGYCLAI